MPEKSGEIDLTLPDIDLATDSGDDPLAFDLESKEPISDPLDGIDYEGNVEKDTPKEMSALLKAFKEKAKAEEKRFREATDSEYWFALCFQTRAQKEAFLQAMKWFHHGDKYLDGTKIARQMKIDLPAADVRFQGEKIDKKMAEIPTI